MGQKLPLVSIDDMNLKSCATILLAAFVPAVRGGPIAYGLCQTGKVLQFCSILFVSQAVISS